MRGDLIDPNRYKQLFVDGGSVELETGVTRTVHQPEKIGPAVRPDASRGETALQSRIAPQWNSTERRWEWWFGTDFATSADGLNWERFALAEAPVHVVRDERDPDPERRYKGLIGGRLESPPVPSADESQFTYDPYNEQFIALVKHSTEYGRSVFLATSDDGEHYSEQELIFHTDHEDWVNCRRRVRDYLDDPGYIKPAIVDDVDYRAEAYHMAVMPYEGLYLGFPMIFNPIGAIPPPHTSYTRINQVELAVSRDLRRWDRVGGRTLFIPIEHWDGARYDTSQVGMSGQPIVRENGEIWVYYIACRMPSSRDQYERFDGNRELYRLNVDPRLFEDETTICIGKLRPDGFVSLDGGMAGCVTSKPFVWKGEDLYVNVDARWGELYAEIVDLNMRPIPGFWVPLEQPPPLRGDHVRGRIDWKGKHDRVFDEPVRVRFYLHHARLYSFWLE